MELHSPQVLHSDEGVAGSLQLTLQHTDRAKLGVTAGPILFQSATMSTKLSLGLFYLRISPFKNGFRIAVYTVMLISGLNSFLNAMGFTWVCQPIHKYWDNSIVTGRCINYDEYFLATACVNAAADLTLLVLPIFILYKLQLPLRRKISAALLLMTGSLYVLETTFYYIL